MTLWFQIIVTIKEDAEGHRDMKDFVRKTGIPLVKEKLAQYIKELKEGIALSWMLGFSSLHGHRGTLDCLPGSLIFCPNKLLTIPIILLLFLGSTCFFWRNWPYQIDFCPICETTVFPASCLVHLYLPLMWYLINVTWLLNALVYDMLC